MKTRVTNDAVHRPFKVVDYDLNWPKLYVNLSTKVKKALSSSIVSIHHVGSTSVPGMVAKPQIDMMAVANDLAEVRKHYKEMREIGFVPRGDYNHINEEYFSIDPPGGGMRIGGIHVFERGSPEIVVHQSVKYFLMTHLDEQKAYATAKLEAAAKTKNDYRLYNPTKTPYIEELLKRVDKWWQQLPELKRREYLSS